jgi:hypothetical protein
MVVAGVSAPTAVVAVVVKHGAQAEVETVIGGEIWHIVLSAKRTG